MESKTKLALAITFSLVSIAGYTVYRSFFGVPATSISAVAGTEISSLSSSTSSTERIVNTQPPDTVTAAPISVDKTAASLGIRRQVAPSYVPTGDDEFYLKKWQLAEPLVRQKIDESLLLLQSQFPNQSASIAFSSLSTDVSEALRTLTAGTFADAQNHAEATGATIRPSLLALDAGIQNAAWLSLVASYREAVFSTDNLKLFVRSGSGSRTPTHIGYSTPTGTQLSMGSLDDLHAKGALIVEVAIPGSYLSSMRTPVEATVGFLFEYQTLKKRWRPVGKIDYVANDRPSLLPWQ